MESIKLTSGTELKENSEKLLNNMKTLRHTANDIIGSTPIKDMGYGCYNLIINVAGYEYPVYYNATTVFADGSPAITDDIFDEDNHLGVTNDDEMLWFALVKHLGRQADLLQEDNNKYNDELVAANEKMDNLTCKLTEEIKARRGYEEALAQLREELAAANNKIDELEADNNRLSARVKSLVIEITELEHENDALKNENANLNQKLCHKVMHATYSAHGGETEDDDSVIEAKVVTPNDDMQYTISLEKMNEVTARINELEEENKILRERISELAVRNNEVEKLLEKWGLKHDDKKSLVKDMKRVISAVMSYDED